MWLLRDIPSRLHFALHSQVCSCDMSAGDYAQGDAEYEVLAAEVEHNPSLSEDTLILPPEEQEYL